MNRAVFLDRDGTLHEDVHFLRAAEDLRLFEATAPALARLRALGFALVVVTNQSGVARGFLTEAELERIHDALRARLAEHGVALDAIYSCPHHPEEARDERYRRACTCRKPRPGMFLQAARELDLDLARSYAIGDAPRDAAAAGAAGVTALHVRTGRTPQPDWPAGAEPAASCADLLEAARWIEERERKTSCATSGS